MSSSDIPSGPDTTLAKSGIVIAAVLFLVVAGFLLGYHQVPEGHTGVYKRFGAVTGAQANPGAHFTLPVAQTVQNVEIRPRTYTMADQQGEGNEPSRADAIGVQSVNGTTFRVDVTIRYRVDASAAAEFVEQWNTVRQAEQRLIRPTVRSQVRDTGGAIQSSVIFTREGRQQLQSAAREALNERFEEEPLVLEAVQIRNVHIPESYQEALNQKEIAKQQVQREQFRVQQQRAQAQRQIIRAEAAARQRLIRANATARSNFVVAQSLNREVLIYQYIQALDRANTVYLPLGEDGLPTYLNVNGSSRINQSAIPSAGNIGGGGSIGGGDGDIDLNTTVSGNATTVTPSP
jgi:regulator of protease activity HflC (stomatin/prohibitin superfamily)